MLALFEKRLPLALSLLFHGGVFLLLLTYQQALPEQPEPVVPLQLHLVQMAAAAEQADQQQPAEVNLSEVQRTSPNASETESKPAPVEGANEETDKQPQEADNERPDEKPAQPEPAPAALAQTEQKAEPPPVDEKVVEQLRVLQQKAEAEQEAKKTKIIAQMDGITAESPGAKRPYFSLGAQSGPTREIDIARYPSHMQERFMARYGIRVGLRLVNAQARTSYVNAVKSNRGTYLNTGGAGVYEVMELPEKVLARMAQLEEEALRERNLDPLRSRVVKVVFGLREISDSVVDLVITDFQAEPIN